MGFDSTPVRAAEPACLETAALVRDRLRQEFGDEVAVFASPGRPLAPIVRLAVAVGESREFARWARTANLRALTVVPGDDTAPDTAPDTVLVGPLAIPGEPGCAECARARRVAAAARKATSPVCSSGTGVTAAPGVLKPAIAPARASDPSAEDTRRLAPVIAAGVSPAKAPVTVADDTMRLAPGGADPASGARQAASVAPENARNPARPPDDAEDTTRVDAAVAGGAGKPAAAASGASARMPHSGPEDMRGSAGAQARESSAESSPVLDTAGAERGGAAGRALDQIVGLVRDILRADARDLIGHVAEVGGAEPVWHRVIPLPACDVCGGATGDSAVALPEEGEDDDPAALLAALAGWVDPVTGVVPWIELRQPLGESGPHTATAASPHLLDADGVPRALPIGWGKGMTRSAAIRSAVGEAIERYSASLPDSDRLAWARPADLDGEILDPREFALYEPEQYAAAGFPCVPFDRRVDHPWVRGAWLGTDTPVWVPAVFAYLAMTVLPEHVICQGTSNGLAAGADIDTAAVRATLELVERDAMMAAWLTGERGRFVELDETLDDDVHAVIEALQAQGPSVEVYLLPTSTYGATAVALAIGDGRRWPGVALGLGADRSPRAAIRAAVLELAQTAPHLAALLRERAHPVPARPQGVREMLDHAAYYFPVERVDAFDRLRCGGTSRLRDLREPALDTSLTDLAGTLGAAGVRVAVVDVTSADVATGPLRVVRAVSPDLQPLSYGHGNDRALVARLRRRGVRTRALIHPVW
ncbi:YcaO-like family protein [Actinokineospora iranica]|uniref:Thiazole/oxazole-forming peptide maturase, SagD family component n=1 Tax=Actinokineospora iranica TaxID=1271860 RepID=A0A1G6JD09_9PSEU|nr:YcaO-like family protein [Actinokineospora iranica]SDC16517.1 thiazole/oxazole-forming peptide maturase, SagD family component [Actinokineospora iranica]